ncbi:hypothetical protein Q4555_11715 [Octadecabacter sp. 1_MG-2023]|uniref:hypothetical protein n=1 Tax=unclassified Octadecabacter TaxID=196158 RepID=UPI001C087F19|nr:MULTISPECIES: hypothetical protein [unclassified Octadecabacter]MBU2993818.1 hypothetical protein [Octadecabacter sp. B2R22]MDO6735336.1 hypothetical protein [Octadecabacter sp. 1_MG-2023]
MIRVALFVCAGFMLAGCDGAATETLPDGVSAADVALFKSAVTDAGCDITNDDQAALVEDKTGFDDATLSIIVQYLTLAGESEPLATGFRLTSGSCANA